MNIQGVEVEIEKIATGMLEMLSDMPENYQVAMQFGMLPAPLMQCLERALEEKAIEIGRDALWYRDVIKAVSSAMLRQANLVV